MRNLIAWVVTGKNPAKIRARVEMLELRRQVNTLVRERRDYDVLQEQIAFLCNHVASGNRYKLTPAVLYNSAVGVNDSKDQLQLT